MMILHDTCMNATEFLLVYVEIDPLEMNMVENGGDSSFIDFLPYGIAIVPKLFQDYFGASNCNGIFKNNDIEFCSGSLMTIGFQILVNNLPSIKFSFESARKANGLISHMTHNIKPVLD